MKELSLWSGAKTNGGKDPRTLQMIKRFSNTLHGLAI